MWADFTQLITSLGQCKYFPASSHQVLLFVAYLSNKGESSSTVSSKLSAISWFHKLHNFNDPTASFVITRAVQGLKKAKPTIQTRLPIDRSLLHNIISILPTIFSSTYDVTLSTAILLLMYHGCFRVGELLFSGSNKHSLCLENIHIQSNDSKPQLQITLQSHKHKSTPTSFILPSSPLFCPVTATLNYSAIRPKTPGVFFIHKGGSPVQRTFLADLIKKSVKILGLNPDLFNTHSIRSGRATDLAREGVPESIIKATGRWSSDAFKKYIQFDCFVLPH